MFSFFCSETAICPSWRSTLVKSLTPVETPLWRLICTPRKVCDAERFLILLNNLFCFSLYYLLKREFFFNTLYVYWSNDSFWKLNLFFLCASKYKNGSILERKALSITTVCSTAEQSITSSTSIQSDSNWHLYVVLLGRTVWMLWQFHMGELLSRSVYSGPHGVQ